MKKLFLTILILGQFSLAKNGTQESVFEVRTAPIAFLAKWVTLDMSYFYKNFAIGPSLINYASPETNGGMLAPTYNGTAYGLHAIVAQSLIEDSIYLSAHTYNESYRSYPHAFLGYENRSGTKTNADAGYRWVREKYSAMLGFGMEWRNHTVESISDSGSRRQYNDSGNSLFHIEFKVGYLL